jgi:(2Fe-2S) ferredoxin
VTGTPSPPDPPAPSREQGPTDLPRARWGRLPEHHVLVCANERPPGNPKGSCGERGSVEVFDALKQEVLRQGATGRVLINRTNCLKPCAFGPTVVVHPHGDWYGGVTPADAQAIIRCTLEGERLEARLLPPEALDSF